MGKLNISISLGLMTGTALIPIALVSCSHAKNSFSGQFSSDQKQKKFKNIKYKVKAKEFMNEVHLSNVSLYLVTTIGRDAFRNSPLTLLSLPKVKNIGMEAFLRAKLTTLSLPEVTNIGISAFQLSNLTSLSLPKAIVIGNSAFKKSGITNLYLPKIETIGHLALEGVVNEDSTKVTLPKEFKNSRKIQNIFPNGYDKIHFTWT